MLSKADSLILINGVLARICNVCVGVRYNLRAVDRICCANAGANPNTWVLLYQYVSVALSTPM